MEEGLCVEIMGYDEEQNDDCDEERDGRIETRREGERKEA